MNDTKTTGQGSPSSATADGKRRWVSSDHRSPAEPKHTKGDPLGLSAVLPPALLPHDRPIFPPAVPAPLHPLDGSPFPHPAALPPYGFQNLECRKVVLPDGSVGSYYALPPDYSMDPAAARFFPSGPEPGFNRHFAPPGGRYSSEDLREPSFGGGAGPQQDYWASLGLDGIHGHREDGPSSLKRKYGDEEEFALHLQHGTPKANSNRFRLGSGGDLEDYMGRTGSPLRREHHDDSRPSKQAKLGGEGVGDLTSRRGRADDDARPVAGDVDQHQQALKRAFLNFSKLINENPWKKKYLDDGKYAPVKCIVCGRASKEFSDVHGLITHAYNSQNVDMRVDHLGLHKAMCVLMGWDYAKEPDNSKAYQSLSADDVNANRDDLILWPPTVIIHNASGKRKGRHLKKSDEEVIDTKLKELGFGGGKMKSLTIKDGRLSITLVRFAKTRAGLKEAERLSGFFEDDNRGRKGWARSQLSRLGGDEDDKNPALVQVDKKTGEKTRILYGYLVTASDLEETGSRRRKNAVIESRRELNASEKF